MLLYASVISLIVVPVVTEMLVSPNCFQYLFTTISTSSYVVQGSSCYWISYTENRIFDRVAVACMSYAELEATYNSGSQVSHTGNYNMAILSASSAGEASTVSFTAGFAYNFQCTFSLLEAFVYIFVYKYVCRMMVLPCLWVTLKQLQTYCYNRYGPSSYWFRYINDCSPLMMRLIDGDAVQLTMKHHRDEVIAFNTTLLHRWHREKTCDGVAKRLKMRVVSDLAIVFAFGLLFPLLGMLALIGVVVDLLMTNWMITRLCMYAERIRGAPAEAKATDQPHDYSRDNTDNHLQPTTRNTDGLPTMSNEEYGAMVLCLVDEMTQACTQQLQEIQHLQPKMLYFAALVWSLGLYDVVGRRVGSVNALWILVVTLTMPGWTSILIQSLFRYTRSSIERRNKPPVDVEIEMMTEVRYICMIDGFGWLWNMIC